MSIHSHFLSHISLLYLLYRIGTRVIKDRDGRPAIRDPTFLSETQIMQKRDADRILKR